MLDLVREEPSPRETREELASKIAEATHLVQRLRQALNTVDSEIGSTPPPAEGVRTRASAASQPQPFRPFSYLKCMSAGHVFINSRAMPGRVTCRRCRVRRRF